MLVAVDAASSVTTQAIKTITITDVWRRTGLSSRTLRLYEVRGLLPAQRTAAGLRCHGEAELARLHNISALKRAGFGLSRIAAMLDSPTLDLPRIIEAQLAALATQSKALADASASLFEAQRSLEAGRQLDLDTFCLLIKQGATIISEHEKWQQVYDRDDSPEEQAEWTALKERAFAGLDMAAYEASWKALTDRIEAALPFDPASDIAQAFLAEWQDLQTPFLREAAPKLAAGATNLYDHIDEWSDIVEPPLSKRVWAAIIAAEAAAKATPSP